MTPDEISERQDLYLSKHRGDMAGHHEMLDASVRLARHIIIRHQRPGDEPITASHDGVKLLIVWGREFLRVDPVAPAMTTPLGFMLLVSRALDIMRLRSTSV